jgi:hypothetical protein
VAARPVDPAKDKCPKQMQVILDVLKEAGPEGLERKVLVEKITSLLATKQAPERILAFYAPAMLTAGLVEKRDKTEIVQVEVADKPKAEKKADETPAPDGATQTPAPKSVRGKKGKVAEQAAETPATETPAETGAEPSAADAAADAAAA